MGLSIKNDAVEAMIRDLAARRGVSMTEALRQALEAELAREEADRAARIAEKRKRVAETVARLRALPVLDDRSPDEILGYDENGLPT